MRQHIDADTERLQFRHALEHFGGDADLVQAERQGQPADTAACNENRHDCAPDIDGVMTRQAEVGNRERRSCRWRLAFPMRIACRNSIYSPTRRTFPRRFQWPVEIPRVGVTATAAVWRSSCRNHRRNSSAPKP